MLGSAEPSTAIINTYVNKAADIVLCINGYLFIKIH